MSVTDIAGEEIVSPQSDACKVWFAVTCPVPTPEPEFTDIPFSAISVKGLSRAILSRSVYVRLCQPSPE